MSPTAHFLSWFRLFLAAAGFLGLASAARAQVILNEVQSANTLTWMDEMGEFDDWVEIRNTGVEPFNLSNWYVSDDPAIPLKWQLPESDELNIASNGFHVLWADGEVGEGVSHLSFSFSQQGEQVLLSNPEGELISSISFGFIWHNMSTGSDGQGAQRYFETATPGEANPTVGKLGVLSPPLFSQNGALLQNGEEPVLALTHPNPAAQIRYTLDGSEPSESSALYATPVEIEGNATMKARAFHPDYIHSQTGSVSFLFEVDHDLEVMSISCLPTLFSGPGGINLVNSNIEIQADVTFFDTGGVQTHAQTMGMRRHALDNSDQHGFRLTARGEYGMSKLHLPVFDDRPYDEYDALILRNSGNDAIELNGSGLRDPLIHRLYNSIDAEYGTSAYKPVVVYINGDYWGMYNLRERQDEHWMEAMYDLSCGEVDYLERTAGESDTRNEICGDWTDFDSFEQSAVDLDLSVDETYQTFIQGMNVRNFMDYQALEIFISNQDWLSNNMKFWRTYEDSKWNWVLWDTDWGFGTFYPNFPHGFPDWNALNFALSDWGGWTTMVETELLQNLTMNEQFVDEFATRTADLMNSYLRAEVIAPQLISMQQRIQQEVPGHINRWGNALQTWEEEVEYMLSFISERGGYMRTHFAERFELGEIYSVELDCAPQQAGTVEVNTIVASVFPWQGLYFEEIPVRLKAIPFFGFEFSHWEGAVSSESAEIFVPLSGLTSLSAVFIEVKNPGDLILPLFTEILSNGSSTPLIQDWAEVYNPGEEPIVFSGWEFCGDGVCVPLNEEAVLMPGEYGIICRDASSFSEFYGDDLNVIGTFDFGLSATSEEISIGFPSLMLGDTVHYASASPWPLSVQEGRSIELIDVILNNDLGQNWISHNVEYGTPGEPFEATPIGVWNETWGEQIAAWPNPFSETFSLSMRLQRMSNATIRLHDAMGRELGTLYHGMLRAGESALIFSSSTHDSLRGIPQGLYVLTIQTGDALITRRIVRR